MIQANQPIQYCQFRSGQWEQHPGESIVETSVSLTVNGEVWLAFMCTPVYLEAMAVGFLYNEGLIQSSAEIASVRVCPTGDNVDVWLHHAAQKPSQWRRTSGCTGGVTGVEAETEAEHEAPRPHLVDGHCLSPDQICGLIEQLFEAQDLYRKSGGVHTSALSDGHNLVLVAEDIGRHNTLDKIAGRCLLERVNLSRRILLTTGRISSEMLQKAGRMGAAVVISRTAPSSLSIHMAEKWGITLIGYARRHAFNVYAHPERIASPVSSAECLEYSSLGSG